MSQLIRLDQVDEGDYLSPESLDEIANERKNVDLSLVYHVLAARNYISLINNGLRPTVTVSQQNGTYRVLDGQEIVSAYAYAGKKQIPVEILEL